MISYDKVLPIGTVVILENTDTRLMILGYQRYASNDDEKIYDYCACTFPEGYLSPEKTILFDHDRIERIIYMGWQNSEQIEFAEHLNKVISKREKENSNE